jgi:hypothetical protein
MEVQPVQVQSFNANLSDLQPGDTAYLSGPTAGHGNVILVVSNFPNLPVNEIALVYLQDGYLEFRVSQPVYRIPYEATLG